MAKCVPDFSILLAMRVCGYKVYQISVFFLATAVCGYKAYRISASLNIATESVAIKHTGFQDAYRQARLWL